MKTDSASLPLHKTRGAFEPSASNLVNKKLTKSQLNSFRAAFNVYDQNGDGTITYKELASVLSSLGIKKTHG